MQRCQIGVLYEGTAQKSAVFGVIPREGTSHVSPPSRCRDCRFSSKQRSNSLSHCLCGPHARFAQPRRSSGARRICSCPRIAADEKRNSMASFRLFAGSELSIGTVLARRSRSPRKSSRGAEHAAGGKSVQFEKEAEVRSRLAARRHSYALLPIGYPLGRFGQYAASRSQMSSQRIGGGSLTGICSDGKPSMCCSVGAFRSREEFTRRVLVNPDLIPRIWLLCSR
jgi:hypothetical protein